MTHNDISDTEIEAVIHALDPTGLNEIASATRLRARAVIVASRAALLAEERKVVAREPDATMKMNAVRLYDNIRRFDDYDTVFAWRAMWDAAP